VIILNASDVPVVGLADFCDSLAREIMKDHEKRFAERMRAIREASSALANTAARFGSSVKNAWGTMDKTASEYGTRLAQTIQETAERLTQAELSPKFPEAEEFHEESVVALNKIIITVRKYVPRLHRGLKAEMAALNTALAKLENSVRSLGAALDESPGTKIESLQRDAVPLAQRQDELLKLRSEEAEQASSLATISNREKELLSEEQELTSQGEFLELKRYEESLRSKEDEIKLFIQPVVKPLLKLERAASANQTSAIDIRTLHGLLETPVETLTTGQSFAIVKVLGQLDDALTRGQLDVEERKRRRAQDTIQHVKNGAIDTIREGYLTIQANIQETLRQLRARGLLEKKNKVGELLAQARKEKETLTARKRDVQRKIDELSKDILKQKTALESQISRLAHRTITIRAG
jgi:hypothetical protein